MRWVKLGLFSSLLLFFFFFHEAIRSEVDALLSPRFQGKSEVGKTGKEARTRVFVLSRLPREVCPLTPLLFNLTIPNGKVNERQQDSNSGRQIYEERARTSPRAWLPAPLLAGGAGWAPTRTRKWPRGRRRTERPVRAHPARGHLREPPGPWAHGAFCCQTRSSSTPCYSTRLPDRLKQRESNERYSVASLKRTSPFPVRGGPPSRGCCCGLFPVTTH